MSQKSLFIPEATWEPPVVSTLPAWDEAKRVGIDVETWDPQLKALGPGVRRKGSRMVGVSFSIEDGPSHYLPFAHSDGGNLNKEHVLAYLRTQAKNFKGVIVGANLQYDLDWLAQNGVLFWDNEIADVQVAEPLIDELRESYNLNSIAENYRLPQKDETVLLEALRAHGYNKNPKGFIGRVHSKFVGAYAEHDARLPLLILRKQERIIEEQDLWKIWRLESKVLPVLLKMRRRGVRVDEDAIGRLSDWCSSQEEEITKKLTHATGVRVTVDDLTKKEAFAACLEEIGVRLGKTPTGKIKLDAKVLAAIDHPVAADIRRAKQVNKLRTTFCVSLLKASVNGRIHCTFNQLRKTDDETGQDKGARFGRLSCTDPNLQQQPSPEKDKSIGGQLRAAFLPDPGRFWACLDYSQQEPRFLVHFAEMMTVSPWFTRETLAVAQAAGEKYRTDPDADNHQMMADMAGIIRKLAKVILLGRMYGMGGGKLCKELGLPTKTKMLYGKRRLVAGPEGQALMQKFDEKLPFVRSLQKIAEAVALQNGYVTTILGRRCRFPKNAKGGYEWTYKALNRIIQGSSADQMKKAMVDADEAGFSPQLQIHDELDLSVSSVDEAMQLAEVMKGAVSMTVPAKVDVEIGHNWGNIQHWSKFIEQQ